MPKVTILGNFGSRFSQGRWQVVGAGEFEVCGNLKNTKGKERCKGKKQNQRKRRKSKLYTGKALDW